MERFLANSLKERKALGVIRSLHKFFSINPLKIEKPVSDVRGPVAPPPLKSLVARGENKPSIQGRKEGEKGG